MSSKNSSVVIDRDGIRMEKSFILDQDRFRIPVIKFEFTSKSEEPVIVRLLDSIPSEFDNDTVGFHEDYEGEYWESLEGNRVAFERRIEPEETVTTLYGIKGPTEDDSYLFEESEPTLYVNDADEDDGEELGNENLESEVQIKDGDAEDDTEETEPKSVENGDVSAPESLKVQIRDIQAKMQEFEAYVGALEEFLNEEGTGEQVIEQVQDDINEIESQLENVDDEIESRVSQTEEQIEAISDKVDGQNEKIEGVESEVDNIEGNVRGLNSRVNETEDTIESHDERLIEVAKTVEGNSEELEEVQSQVSTAQNIAEAAKQSADEANEGSEKAEENSERIESMEEDMQEVKDGLDDIQERFNALQNAFGN